MQAFNPGYYDDPFREPVSRWHGTRGCFYRVSYHNPEDRSRYGSIYLPLPPSHRCPLTPEEADWPKLPGVILGIELGPHQAQQGHGQDLMCCGDDGELWVWGLETLAQAGYMVFAAPVGYERPDTGNAQQNQLIAGQHVKDANDWFLASPKAPAFGERGQFNPWWRSLNTTQIGMAGHSGAGSASCDIGQRDPRVDAIVALDPAQGCLALEKKIVHVPQINIDAEGAGLLSSAGGKAGSVPFGTIMGPVVPVANQFDDYPKPIQKHLECRQFLQPRGVDCMTVSVRGSTHIDWTPTLGNHSRYGPQIGNYYMLAWFDRYLRGQSDPQVKADATKRLTATFFDNSVDVFNFGEGVFDAGRAQAFCQQQPSPICIEAGNAPIMIDGLSAKDMASFYFPSYYALNRGKLVCKDLRRAAGRGCARS